MIVILLLVGDPGVGMIILVLATRSFLRRCTHSVRLDLGISCVLAMLQSCGENCGTSTLAVGLRRRKLRLPRRVIILQVRVERDSEQLCYRRVHSPLPNDGECIPGRRAGMVARKWLQESQTCRWTGRQQPRFEGERRTLQPHW